jgi:DNA-binding CsgD family transcriptional regulator
VSQTVSAFTALLADAHAAGDLTAAAGDHLRHFGFKAFAVGIFRGPDSLASFGNVDRKLNTEYTGKNYFRTDPIQNRARNSWLPVAWDIETDLSDPRYRALFEISYAAGYCQGVSACIRGPSGAHVLISGYWEDGARVSRRGELSAIRELIFVGLHSTNAYFERIAPAKAHDRLLTPRERECLRWTSLGKTAGEMAEILSISDRTANFHVQNFIRKLGASSKLHAVILAMDRGLIPPD